jgi:hypothetical protein
MSEPTLPPLDFSGFVLSLASGAMVNLGQVPADEAEAGGPPATGARAPVDLPAAKQMIDILGILADKTRGNLDPGEDKLLKSLIYDLRVQYVDAEKKHRAAR